MFKDTTGNFLTQSLFLELSYNKPQNAIYTLKDEDYEHNGKEYKSIRKLYLEIADPTEYEFANQCFANWRHWQRISNSCTNLQPYIQEWRDELEIKLRSQGIKRIAKEARGDNKNAMQAARWLADRNWTEKRSAGRPSKEEVDRETKVQARIKTTLNDDLARVRDVN